MWSDIGLEQCTIYLASGMVGNIGSRLCPMTCGACRLCGGVVAIVEDFGDVQPTQALLSVGVPVVDQPVIAGVISLIGECPCVEFQ